MTERAISEAEVQSCLENYDISYADKKGNPIYIANLATGRRIKVVVEAGSSDPIIVITVAD